MSKVMLLHYITILCKTTWGNSVQVTQVELSDIQRHACIICKLQYTVSSFFCNCRAYSGIPWYTHMTWSPSMLLEWVVEREVVVLTVHPYFGGKIIVLWTTNITQWQNKHICYLQQQKIRGIVNNDPTTGQLADRTHVLFFFQHNFK